MGLNEIEMKRQIEEGWIPDAEYRVFQGGTFARDYCAEITAERDQLRAEVEALTKKLKESRDAHLYQLAEMENVRRIASADVRRAREYACQPMAKSLLLALDNLDSALRAAAPALSRMRSASAFSRSACSFLGSTTVAVARTCTHAGEQASANKSAQHTDLRALAGVAGRDIWHAGTQLHASERLCCPQAQPHTRPCRPAARGAHPLRPDVKLLRGGAHLLVQVGAERSGLEDELARQLALPLDQVGQPHVHEGVLVAAGRGGGATEQG